jgi:hypothetical protein
MRPVTPLIGRSLTAAAVVSGFVLLAGTAAPASAATPYTATPLSTWSPNGPVYATHVSHGVIYIGGSFTSLTNPATGVTIKADRIAALKESNGALIKKFHPHVNKMVRAITTSHTGNVVYVGGKFTKANGARHLFVAAFTKHGKIYKHWKARANNNVRTLLVADKRLYLGGDFDRINGVLDRGVGAVSETTGVHIKTFKGSAEFGPVYAMALSSNKRSLILGGQFKQLDNTARNHLGSVGLKTGALHKWSPTGICQTCFVLAVVAHTHYVYAGISGPGGEVIGYRTTRNTRLWLDWGNGDVQALAYRGGILYVGGHFKGYFHGVTREQLAAVHPTTGAVRTFAPDLEPKFPGTWTLLATPGRLWAGGGFTSVVGSKDARLTAFPAG